MPGGARVELENVSDDAVSANYAAQLTGVAPDYFELLDVPLMAGRGLTTVDAGADAGTIAGDTARASDGGVLVNEAFVRQLLDGGYALGRRLRFVPRPEGSAMLVFFVGGALHPRALELSDGRLNLKGG